MTLTNTINERLNQYLEETQMTVVELSRKTGLPKSNLYKWIKGTKPSDPEDYKKLDEFLILESIPERSGLDELNENGKIEPREEENNDPLTSPEASDKSKVNIFISYSSGELGDIIKDYIRLVRKNDLEKKTDRRSALDNSLVAYYRNKYIRMLELLKDIDSNALTINEAIEMIDHDEDNEWMSIKEKAAHDRGES